MTVVAGAYVIFYTVVDSNLIGISRILHGKRDIPIAYFSP